GAVRPAPDWLRVAEARWQDGHLVRQRVEQARVGSIELEPYRCWIDQRDRLDRHEPRANTRVQLLVQDAVGAELDRRRRDLVAGMELDAAAELELKRGVVDGFPRLGEAWHEVAVDVAFEEIVVNVVVDRQASRRVGQIRVEAVEVRFDVDGQLAGRLWRGGG